MEMRKILPGVRLHAVQTDQFKTACLSVSLLRPLCPEEASCNALLPSVLLRGTREYRDMAEISKFLDLCYGAGVGSLIRKKGEVQTLGFYADFLQDALAPDGTPVLRRMIAFLGQLLLHPVLEQGAFRREFVEGERLNLVNTIASRINDKRTYASKRLLETMFAHEAYGTDRLGDVERVEQITPQSLYEHYQKVLATSQIELFYMGQATADTVAELLREALQTLPRQNLVQAETVLHPAPAAVRTLEEQMDITQGKLCLGLRTPITLQDARYPALLLLNAVFGGGVSSKLFRNVREKRSICYYASSSVDAHKGVMMISSGIDPGDYETARDAILAELHACQAGQITEEELEMTRRYVLSSLRAGMDSPGRLDDYSLGQIVAHQDGTMEQLMDQVRQTTLEQVVAAAKTLQLDTIYFLKGMED
ncbi:MAG: insulinase family protein [Clostridiales bacterium]|nr:insulinase family protein [Clostridiales bacterium]